jgi:hypothetical protein
LKLDKPCIDTGKSRSVAVYAVMASRAERNQVLLRIVSRQASKSLVVDLNVGHYSARLASPAIAT